MRLLIEYKFYEPAFYSTDIADWGTRLCAPFDHAPRFWWILATTRTGRISSR